MADANAADPGSKALGLLSFELEWLRGLVAWVGVGCAACWAGCLCWLLVFLTISLRQKLRRRSLSVARPCGPPYDGAGSLLLVVGCWLLVSW